jgi:hypothetical protein
MVIMCQKASCIDAAAGDRDVDRGVNDEPPPGLFDRHDPVGRPSSSSVTASGITLAAQPSEPWAATASQPEPPHPGLAAATT